MTAPRPASPITAMWAWDNPVDPGLDPRGRAYAPASADRLAAFARAGGLREVHLLVPSRPAEPAGPVDDWLRTAVAALHDAGVAVTAVTGPLPDDGATARWAATTAALAPFDRLQVAVLRWVPVAAATGAPLGGEVGEGVGGAVARALEAVRAVGTGRPVDACVPWWFATERAPDGRSLLEPVVERAERVVLAAPASHAEGSEGVLGLAAPAVATLVAAERPFTIGVQVDSPDAAGGADRTFWEEGPVALIRECGLVAGALAGTPGFEGVAVHGHRAWRRLLGV